MPGANGIVANNYLVHQVAADGTTFIAGSGSQVIAAAEKNPAVKYDPGAFEFIGSVQNPGTVLIAAKSAIPRLTNSVCRSGHHGAGRRGAPGRSIHDLGQGVPWLERAQRHGIQRQPGGSPCGLARRSRHDGHGRHQRSWPDGRQGENMPAYRRSDCFPTANSYGVARSRCSADLRATGSTRSMVWRYRR